MRGRCGTAADCRRDGRLLHVEKKYFHLMMVKIKMWLSSTTQTHNVRDIGRKLKNAKKH